MSCMWCSRNVADKASGIGCKPECRLHQFVEDNEVRFGEPWLREMLPIIGDAVRDLRIMRAAAVKL